MDRNEIVALMDDVFTSAEAAEYLNISTQRLNQLVHDHKLKPIKANKSIMLFYKKDLIDRQSMNIVNNKEKIDSFDIDSSFIREVILYYTIQQYFNYNDSKTLTFISSIRETNNFDFNSGLKINIDLLSKLLKVTDYEFYSTYTKVKNSFSALPKEVVISKKGDETYSKLLSITNEAPPYLFLKGDINLLNEKSVCVVGSRNASIDSMNKTKKLVSSLVRRNIVVNAGLARGIDTAAHTSVLENNGKTIAVIGTAINQYYPKENKELQLKIEEKGLVVSQYPPCNPVNKWNFPTRNGVMSGLALATIIMEAGETSGALKQADYSLKQNRIVLIPKSAVDNKSINWPKKYISKGAHEFKTLGEALEILNTSNAVAGLFDENDIMEIRDVEMDKL